jgi:protein-S-isoprenylcysteine O-methyltransferase Ste14
MDRYVDHCRAMVRPHGKTPRYPGELGVPRSHRPRSGDALPLDRAGAATTRIWHVGYDGAYLLAILTFAGLLFTWWARIYLGRLWSGAITRKEGHYVVDTGPYALVRHPIYTGLIGATLATATAQATATAILGCIFVLAGLWLKARREEHFLSDQLDSGAYASYRRRVPMLVPFI